MELIALIVLVYAVKCAVDDARSASRKSRAAYHARYPQATGPRRAVRSVQHDIGYWTAQVARGFPVARQGFSAGWREGRQAKAEGKPLPRRSRLVRRIDRGAPAGEAAEGRESAGEGATSAPPAAPSPAPAPESRPSYSYGRAGMPAAWPTDDLGDAHFRAQQMSTGGAAYEVREYPPGGGPGTLLATYLNGRPVPAEDGEATRATAGQETPTEGSPAMAADTTYDGVLACMRAAKADAEGRAAEQQRASQVAATTSEMMQVAGVDPATLSAMADLLDAHDEATKAQNRVQEAAATVEAALQRGHAGLNEAHQSAPVTAADKTFYEG